MKLILGDCLEKMKELPDKSVDCFVCDLPYGCLSVKRGGKREGKLKDPNNPNSNIVVVNKPCDWDIPLNLDLFWEQVKRLAKNDHTPVLMFCNARFGFELYSSNPSWFRYDIVWAKTNGVGFLSANKQPLRSHELIYVFSKKGAYYKRVDIEGDFPNTIRPNHKRSGTSNTIPRVEDIPQLDRTGIRCVKSVVEIANQSNKGGKHPTQKPAELYEWILKRYCPEGGTMLDPTAGSFTSVFVANKMGLDGIGIEKNEAFYNKANEISSSLC
ncbi:MAG: site-specific DNA-methyltransferase [Chlorobiales bacterium]|nr:site-specific DNA-methyltransferase [Chlorobiales bacterium]